MKTIFIKTASWLIPIILIALSYTAFSQKITIWKGGTPGMKTEWYCPQNWSTSVVPDEFSDVIIPDVSTSSFALPILPYGKVEINALFIRDNATLTIARDAELIVLGNAEGIDQVNGEIILKNEPSEIMETMISGN